MTDLATPLSGRERAEHMNRLRRRNLDALYETARLEALNTFVRHRIDPLFVAGLALYWGEGDKRTRHQVRITNTDPALIRTFLAFLRIYADLPEERVWVSLIVYPDIVISECEQYWQNALGLGSEHFQKTVVIQGRGTERRSQYGICILGLSSAVLKVKMQTWIAELAKNLYS